MSDRSDQSRKNFALIGAAGFIAPKHLRAIFETGNRLVAALDKHDSVGILDSYFPDASFFTEFERFDRFLEKQRREVGGNPVDYISICSPNYLHDAHCRLALRNRAHAICEKPLVINPWNLDQLFDLEQEYGRRIFTVLQLRLHGEIQRLKREVGDASSECKSRHDICLTYITRRGRWYHQSWKGDDSRSGGLAMNIGVHFFDFLLWIFGSVQRSTLHISQLQRAAGVLELERARVRWYLSVDGNDVPIELRRQNRHIYRSIVMDEKEIDLSEGFDELHTKVYKDVLGGGGFGIDAAKPAIELIHQIRHSKTVADTALAHPMVRGEAPSSSSPFIGGPEKSMRC